MYQPNQQQMLYLGQAGYQPMRPMQPWPMAQMQSQSIPGRMVSSREEAQAIPMDYSAGAMFMPDLPHGVIYAKVVQQNGEAPLFAFRMAPAEEKKKEPAYAAAEEVEALKAELRQLREELSGGYQARHARGGSAE